MTDPAVQAAYEVMEHTHANLLDAAVRMHEDPLHHQRTSNLIQAANAFAKAQEEYLAVLATLGDGTS